MMAASDNSDVLTFVKNLEREFKVTVGPLDFYLGMQKIRLEDGSLFLNHNAYARKILEKYRMSECNAVTTPCEGKSSKDHEEALLDDEVPYRQAVGSLMYLMMATRPDISYAVSVSEFKFKELEAYCDADYGGDLNTRRSRTGIVCKYSARAITWASQKQKSVVLSTTEAEYVAASEESTTQVPSNSQRTRNFTNEMRYHFVREKYQEGVVKIEHIDGQKQIADIMTKPLPRIRFEILRNLLGVIRLEEEE
ncbi:hypothetical protein JTB14_010564 [Gonioctena quinquepunctata]|nr:hypothetical protein JTB14_010564 [Gonioctena quinquepunctata]